ncbi:hypothetical protein GpartN1_g6093.t1 [Galdieria partita]|uniref:Phosphoglucomutase n=1 Tax=Galdieria partita TaxID=83374 RepID=A0A9C7UT38_9RHOD|nr:hypothetical protein GpartN1_g6093.t1 [Galdieria partita]
MNHRLESDTATLWNHQLLVKKRCEYLGYLVWFPSRYVLQRVSFSTHNYCIRCQRPLLCKASTLKATDIHPSVTEQSQLIPSNKQSTLKQPQLTNPTLESTEERSASIYVAEIALRVVVPYRDGAFILNEESGLSDITCKFLEKPQRVHAFVSALRKTLGDRFTSGTFFLGGDGRYYAKEALIRILYTCLGFGNVALVVAKDGLASIPAASLAIHHYSCEGGILCSVNRKAAGEQQFFGIQYLLGNGGPMRDIFLTRFRNQLDKVTEYRVVGIEPQVDISTIRQYFVDDNRHFVSMIDPLELYVAQLKQWFPFARIRRFLQHHSQFLLVDTLHSIMGRYAYRILVEELGLSPFQILHQEYKEDYGGLHPDPYDEDNYQRMKEQLRKEAHSKDSNRLGVVLDNEGRYAVLVTPQGTILSTQDSLAVFLTCIGQVIPRFSKVFRGVGKTFVHSRAIDRVTDVLDMPLYQSPCGWRYMTNLMDREKVDICMDENGGLGCSWIRERDGLFLVLCWLSLLSWKNENRSYWMDIHQVMEQHWNQYGRDYHICYFYRAKNAHQKQLMISKMQSLWDNMGKGLSWKEMHPHLDNKKYKNWLEDLRVEEYQCYNPFEGLTYSRLGICLYMKDTHRIILRLNVVPTETSENELIDVENVIGLAIYLENSETHRIANIEHNDVEEICQPLWEFVHSSLTDDWLEKDGYVIEKFFL